jgi:cytosine/adenosine deaminase-related metal-dependent hydrolase
MNLEQHAGARAPQPSSSRPTTLLVKHADVLVTMDDTRRELRDAGLYIEGNRIVGRAERRAARTPPTKCSTCAAIW